MKHFLCGFLIFLTGCGGRVIFGSDRVVYKNFHDKLSCTQVRCCYPYDEKFMICNQGATDGDGLFIRYKF